MAEQEYRVGYCKPPRHSQFKPGESGNARGRPKGSRGLKTDLAAELAEQQEVPLNEYTTIKGTRQRLLVKTLAMRAAAGDLKAASILLPLIIQVLGTEDRGETVNKLSPEDRALLDELLTRDILPNDLNNDV